MGDWSVITEAHRWNILAKNDTFQVSYFISPHKVKRKVPSVEI